MSVSNSPTRVSLFFQTLSILVYLPPEIKINPRVNLTFRHTLDLMTHMPPPVIDPLVTLEDNFEIDLTSRQKVWSQQVHCYNSLGHWTSIPLRVYPVSFLHVLRTTTPSLLSLGHSSLLSDNVRLYEKKGEIICEERFRPHSKILRETEKGDAKGSRNSRIVENLLGQFINLTLYQEEGKGRCPCST